MACSLMQILATATFMSLKCLNACTHLEKKSPSASCSSLPPFCTNQTTKVKMKDTLHFNKYTVAEFLALPKKRTGGVNKLPKILHWPLKQSPLQHLVTFPKWLNDANWLRDYPGGKTFEVKLQLVLDNQETSQHYDNTGCDTWMKLLAGKVLVATWSFQEAREYGMDDWDGPIDWNKLHKMSSARLFYLRQGDVLVLPAGTYHYVYTAKRKLVVAGDFLNASGWRTRSESVSAYGRDSCHDMPLERIFAHGVLRTEQARAKHVLQEHAQHGTRLSAERAAYLRNVIEWGDALDEEARCEDASVQLKKTMGDAELCAALAQLRHCLNECAPH